MSIRIPAIPKVEIPKFDVKPLNLSHVDKAVKQGEKVSYLAALSSLKTKTINGANLDDADKKKAAELKNKALANGWMTAEDAAWYLKHI